MIAGPRTVVRSRRAPASITTRPSIWRVDQLALHALGEVVEDQAVGLEHVLQATRVLPPAAHDVRLDAQPAVDEVLDRVGDLELPARRGLDRARRVVDLRGEHVDAHERQVGGRLGRLLDEAHDPADLARRSLGELGDAVVLRVGHRRQQDQRVRLVLAEGRHEIGDPALQQVVAEIHHERARPRGRPRR